MDDPESEKRDHMVALLYQSVNNKRPFYFIATMDFVEKLDPKSAEAKFVNMTKEEACRMQADLNLIEEVLES